MERLWWQRMPMNRRRRKWHPLPRPRGHHPEPPAPRSHHHYPTQIDPQSAPIPRPRLAYWSQRRSGSTRAWSHKSTPVEMDRYGQGINWMLTSVNSNTAPLATLARVCRWCNSPSSALYLVSQSGLLRVLDAGSRWSHYRSRGRCNSHRSSQPGGMLHRSALQATAPSIGAWLTFRWHRCLRCCCCSNMSRMACLHIILCDSAAVAEHYCAGSWPLWLEATWSLILTSESPPLLPESNSRYAQKHFKMEKNIKQKTNKLIKESFYICLQNCATKVKLLSFHWTSGCAWKCDLCPLFDDKLSNGSAILGLAFVR